MRGETAAAVLISWTRKCCSVGSAKWATAMLARLAANALLRDTVSKAGAIPVMVQLLTEAGSVQRVATGALSQLATDPELLPQIVTAGAVPLWVQMLSQPSNSRLLATTALSEIARDEGAREAILQAGAIPLLVQILREGSVDSKCSAADVLCELATYADQREPIASAGVIPLLVQLLKDGNEVAQETAITGLTRLSKDGEVNRVVAVEAVSALVKAVGSTSPQVKKAALVALSWMCWVRFNHEILLWAGAVPLFIEVLTVGTDVDKVAVCRNLRGMSRTRMGRTATVEAGAVRLLVQLLKDDSREVRDAAKRVIADLVRINQSGFAALRCECSTLQWLQQHGAEDVRTFATKAFIGMV
jgi:hypothetical protein